MGFIYRNARKPDLEAMMAIEAVSHPHPWDEKAFVAEFSKAACGMNIFLAAEDDSDGTLAGYSVGNVIVDYVHILDIAVAEKYKRQGLAAGLLRRTEAEAFKRGLGSMTLEVRASNTPALNLYRKMGFVERARRPGPANAGEDDVVMWKNIL